MQLINNQNYDFAFNHSLLSIVYFDKSLMYENYNEVEGHFAKQCLLFKQKNCRLQSAFSKHKQDKTGGKKACILIDL